MPARTFADLYCARHGLTRQSYHAHVFRRALFPHARLLAGLVKLFRRMHFLPDHEFVEETAYLTGVADFSQPLGSFLEHPANRSVLRRTFRLRLSARRLLRLVRETFAESPGGTFRL